jgi:hypothetical protein
MMIGTTLQILFGSLMFCALMALDRQHFHEAIGLFFPNFPKFQTWVTRGTRIALGIAVTGCLLDPLIPGYSHLTVSIPENSNAYPSTSVMPNLRLRVTPTGILGPAGGDRIEYIQFDGTGSSEVTAKLGFLETAVRLQLFDQTRPTEILKSMTVYVSPFIRQRMISKKITL